jgi:hypothetical protein
MKGTIKPMSAYAFTGPLPGDVFARSVATNIPLAVAVIIAVAGIVVVMQWSTENNRNRTFLRALAATDCDDALLLRFMDATDTLELARRHLTNAKTEPETSKALRKAMAAAM